MEWADSSDRTATAELWQTVFPLPALCLGKEKALPLLEKYGADALFADENHKVYLTEGMEERFELMKDTYKVQK